MSVVVSNFSRYLPYLDGSKFEEQLTLNYEIKGVVQHRNDVIVNVCSGKRVLHVGCTDHIPLIKAKIAKKEWLHGLLTEHSSYTLGVDIDRNAVREASHISKLNNMIAGDITNADKLPEISGQRFDIALFGEVVEHIPNPVSFLQRFRENYQNNFETIIITVPSAFRAGNLKGIFRHSE